MKLLLRRLIVFGLSCALLIGCYLLLQNKILRAAYPISYEHTVFACAKKYNLEPALIYAVIRTESSWREDAVSSAGARGLMQVTSPTFDFIMVKAGWSGYAYGDILSPELNIEFGSFFLSYLIEDFEGYTNTALAAYNAGRGNVQKWLRDPRYSTNGKSLTQIPFRETRNYVKKINASYHMYTRLYFENNNFDKR